MDSGFDTPKYLSEESKDLNLLREVSAIMSGDIVLHKCLGITAGTIGCTYRYGAFIVNSENYEVYRLVVPNYYDFLCDWYNK